MWFEADSILPYLTINEPLLSDFGFDRGRLPDAWSEFAASRAVFDRNDPLTDLDWSAGVAPLIVDQLSAISAKADEWGKAVTSKDGFRVMNEDGVITVTGTRYSKLDTYGWWDSGPGADYWTYQNEDIGGIERDPDCHCAGMTEAERLERAVDAEVTEILREILAMPRQDMEYGSRIYIDSNGFIQHTPLTETAAVTADVNARSLPIDPTTGINDFSTVVAIVHSHPAYIAANNTNYYVPGSQYLREPWAGDWAAYDGNAALITSAGGSVANFDQYIIGWGDGGFVIAEYSNSDRSTSSIADAEIVDPNTEACTCSPGS